MDMAQVDKDSCFCIVIYHAREHVKRVCCIARHSKRELARMPLYMLAVILDAFRFEHALRELSVRNLWATFSLSAFSSSACTVASKRRASGDHFIYRLTRVVLCGTPRVCRMRM